MLPLSILELWQKEITPLFPTNLFAQLIFEITFEFFGFSQGEEQGMVN